MKILIVDDQKIIRQMIKSMTKESSYEYVEASNGKEGLDILDNNEDVSLILLDLNMPIMDGLEMLIKMRKDEIHTTTPVIFISSARGEDAIEKAKELGIKKWLHKPFKKDELLATIDSATKDSVA